MGLTSKAMLSVIYAARHLSYRGVIYFFPTRSDVSELSKGRFNPLIEENPDSIGKWIRDTDSATVKRIHDCFVYFRGMRSNIAVKNIPADFLVFDELDEAPPKAVDMAMERLAHSKIGRVMMLSNPTLPDYGVNKAFQTTDQRYWLLKCPACNEWTCMEDTFPDCLHETAGGRVIRACVKCGAELDPAVGEWVPKKPGVTERRGYHYSQLFSKSMMSSPRAILDTYRTTDNFSSFYNLKIGIAYVEAENRVSIENILSLCGDHGISTSDLGPCSMGVDQGKDLHVVIGKRDSATGSKIIHLGVYLDWEELDRLMKDFRVQRCVVDAMPEMRNARDFSKRHRGKVFLNFYSGEQKGAYAWDYHRLVVRCNRTESLEASHNQLLHGMIVLPKECDMTHEFARHCHNAAKKIDEDEKTGVKRYVYVKLGPDHFRHAFNYERMAAEEMKGVRAPTQASPGTMQGTSKSEELPEEWAWINRF